MNSLIRYFNFLSSAVNVLDESMKLILKILENVKFSYIKLSFITQKMNSYGRLQTLNIAYRLHQSRFLRRPEDRSIVLRAIILS
jgi:hypothetical protein